MDAELKNKTLALANEFATQATTIGELNSLMQTLMKSALQQMLDSELQFHLKHQANQRLSWPDLLIGDGARIERDYLMVVFLSLDVQ